MRAVAAIVLALAALLALAAAKDVVNLNVPMIHQRWDVPSWSAIFNIFGDARAVTVC